ncbi:MAG: hypothetical protein KJ666_08005 [Bacteroidetes bacterium]|nr:hypothetical protein [Bacteroidota bacterium]MBU2585700.1 hypothetical protein [Bacteroidota bacterium]
MRYLPAEQSSMRQAGTTKLVRHPSADGDGYLNNREYIISRGWQTKQKWKVAEGNLIKSNSPRLPIHSAVNRNGRCLMEDGKWRKSVLNILT